MATFPAASTSLADVQAACDLATAAGAGSRVEVPAGTSNWTGKLTFHCTGGQFVGAGSTSITGGNNVTVFNDNYNADDNLMDFQGLSEIAGITVQGGTATTPKDGGRMRVGDTTDLRIHHCTFNTDTDAGYQMIQFGSGVRGVMYQCAGTLTSDNLLPGFFFYNGRFGGGGDTQGNYEWTQPTAFGTDDYFYIEDCSFVNTDRGRIWDGFTAAKVVVRFCTVVNGGLSEAHATGHSADDRGTRSQEIYGNFASTDLVEPSFAGVDLSSGTTLAWGNSWDEAYKNVFITNVTRKSNATYGQTATPNGWGYAGTAFNGTGSNWDGGTLNGTNTTLGYPCLDQPGRGAGQLLVGLMPSKTNQATGTIAWPNQALEPIYLWNNTGAVAPGWGGNVISDNSGGRVVANRDYYQQASGIQTSPTSPFNGTTGTGWGTIANRPTTCTTGVGYWATDEGDWNESDSNPYGVNQAGNSGRLYIATATNTWTLYYEPYTYPHPLRNETPGDVTINTTNLTTTNLVIG